MMKDILNMRRFKEWFGLRKSIAMYYWKPYGQKRLRHFYGQFVRAGDLCFDIGAHVGNRTQAWMALGANVVALEPQPVCAKYLQRRFRRNVSITIVEEAVGRTAGNATLHISSANPTISTMADEGWRDQIRKDARYAVGWDREVVSRVTTLDALISRFGTPAFCKIDVENAEYEVLMGLSQAIPALSFEYYPPAIENTFLCLERLSALGPYEYNWSMGESLRMRSSEWVDAGRLRGHLEGYSTRYEYGDIYARILENEQIANSLP